MDLTRRSVILGSLALTVTPTLAKANPGILGGRAFGSTWRLVAGTANTATILPRITRVIDAIDVMMSPYRTASHLSRFNRADVSQVVVIPDMMARVVDAALATGRATDGHFDPTTGPITHRFGFGPIVGQPGGADQITLDGTALHKSAPGVTLDLCGLAKGFALDCLIDELVAQGGTDFLLELGGELRAVGRHPSGRPWTVAIEDPVSPEFAVRHIVAPGDLALATSGHRHNGLVGDVALSHVIDPVNNRPATGYAASVSVLAETGMEADALATALLAMGREGPAFARAHNISGLFIIGPHDTGASIPTGQFASHLVV